MSEANLWKEMKKNVGHMGHFSRIESHDTSSGFPDVNFCVLGVEGNIELKFEDDEKKIPEIRPSQIRWMNKRDKAGGNIWFLVHWANRYMLIRGCYGKFIYNKNNLSLWINYSAKVWHVKRMNWNEMMDLILAP